MTQTALPVVESFTQSIHGFTANMWINVPFAKWPYWPAVGLFVAIIVVFLPFWWYYNNFIRYTAGELPKDVIEKHKKDIV